MSIPDPILGQMISYLPISDLPSLHLVSHSFSSLIYSYYPLTLHDPPLRIEALSRYLKVTFSYTKTTCIMCLRVNTVLGSLWCEACTIKRSNYREDLYTAINTKLGLKDRVRRFPIKYIYFLFKENKDGYIFSFGVYTNKDDGMRKPEKEEIKKLESHGFKYKDCGYESVEEERCKEWNILNKEPFILMQCDQSIECNMKGDILPCTSHNFYEGEARTIPTIKAGVKGSEFIVMEPLDLKGITFSFENNRPVSWNITPILSLKYGIIEKKAFME